MTLRITILGCGSSGGVPRVAQGWGKCDPQEPKNRRRRCSILVERIAEAGRTQVLIDTSPDLREQLIDAGVTHLDAVVFTHEHADHTHGIDDLRPLFIAHRRRVPVFADDQTMDLLQARFGYCFSTPIGSDYPPILSGHLMSRQHPLVIEGKGGTICLQPIEVEHGTSSCLAFRIDDIAYMPDVNAIPEASLRHLERLDCWIIDALRDTPHPTHFSLREALGWIDRMKPRRAVLTNLHTDLDYGRLMSELPAHIRPAYDGMQIFLLEENLSKF
jgi:phosphoribosyl 1,2-cyclic phosphate phosphodiesterase